MESQRFFAAVELANATVRAIGLILLLFTPYWYWAVIGIVIIALVPMPNADGQWAWRFFHSDVLDHTLRIITEFFVLALGLWGIYLFPYFERANAEWLAGAAGVICVSSWLATVAVTLLNRRQ